MKDTKILKLHYHLTSCRTNLQGNFHSVYKVLLLTPHVISHDTFNNKNIISAFIFLMCELEIIY